MADPSQPTVALSGDVLIVTKVTRTARSQQGIKNLQKSITRALRRNLTIISADTDAENLLRAIMALGDALKTVARLRPDALLALIRDLRDDLASQESTGLPSRLAALRRTAIDADFARMATDLAYQSTVLEIAREFARSDWEAFRHGEDQALQGGDTRL